MRLRDLIGHRFDDAHHLAGRLITPFLRELKELGCSQRKEAIAAVKGVYDAAAKAIDFPFVGEATERQWEEEFWNDTVLPLLNQAADRICGPVATGNDFASINQLKQFNAPA